MPGIVDKKVAIVNGGGRDIGRGIAMLLAEDEQWAKLRMIAEIAEEVWEK
jgi:NAD(P)-dependent dehydrogenase (short-subunit alcohol dehydrogenase family)